MDNQLNQFMSLVSVEQKKAKEEAKKVQKLKEEKEERQAPKIDVNKSLGDFFTIISEARNTPVSSIQEASIMTAPTGFETEVLKLVKEQKDLKEKQEVISKEEEELKEQNISDDDMRAKIKSLILKDKLKKRKKELAKEQEVLRLEEEDLRRIDNEKKLRLSEKLLEEIRTEIKENKKVLELSKNENQSRIDSLKSFFNRLDSFEESLDQKEKINKSLLVDALKTKEEISKELKEVKDIPAGHVYGQKITQYLPPKKELNEVDNMRREFNHFRKMVTQQMASIGGGGAVNLLDLDDIDTSSLGNGKFLVYNSTSGKLEFTDQVDGN